MDIQTFLKKIEESSKNIPVERIPVLTELVDFIVSKKGDTSLIYVCTHNSRRSQFSQVWSTILSGEFGFNQIKSFSAGTETTACNERTIASLKRTGLEVKSEGESPNFKYTISGTEQTKQEIILFSKLIDDSVNPVNNFASIMTCSHADENCPVIIGADQRIPVRFEDPKAFDNTDLEAEKYDERSLQIASELYYVFKVVNEKLTMNN